MAVNETAVITIDTRFLDAGTARALTQLQKISGETARFAREQQKANQVVAVSRGNFSQVGIQLQDFAIQVGSGQSALVAFSQQFSQLASIAQTSGSSFGVLGRALSGPVGILSTLAITILPLVFAWFKKTAEVTDAAAASNKEYSKAGEIARTATNDLAQATKNLDEITGRKLLTDAEVEAQSVRNIASSQMLTAARQAEAKVLLETARAALKAREADLNRANLLTPGRDAASGLVIARQAEISSIHAERARLEAELQLLARRQEEAKKAVAAYDAFVAKRNKDAAAKEAERKKLFAAPKVAAAKAPERISDLSTEIADAAEREAAALALRGDALTRSINPLAEFTAKLFEYKDLLDKGAISAATFASAQTAALDALEQASAKTASVVEVVATAGTYFSRTEAAAKEMSEETSKWLSEAAFPLAEFTDQMASAASGVVTGSIAIKDAVADMVGFVLKELAKLAIAKFVTSIFGAANGAAVAKGGEMMAAAKGAAFAGSGATPFASGGIVRSPTNFAFASGGVPRLGLMGEAGAEAIMPLKRDGQGRLGVRSAAPVINIINQAGVNVTTDEAPNGDINVLIKRVEDRLASGVVAGGSMMSRALESAYGVSRARR